MIRVPLKYRISNKYQSSLVTNFCKWQKAKNSSGEGLKESQPSTNQRLESFKLSEAGALDS